MSTKKRRPGTLAPAKYAPTDADRGRGGLVTAGEESILRDLDERLRAWGRENEGRRDATLTLDAKDAWTVLAAAERALRHVDSVRREARAWEVAMAAPFARRAEAYARAREFPLPRSIRFAPFVLSTYLSALGLDEWGDLEGGGTIALGRPWWIETAHPEEAEEWQDTREHTPQRALEATTAIWGYSTPSACRKALVRWRAEIQRNRSGWRAAFPPNFPLPSNR